MDANIERQAWRSLAGLHRMLGDVPTYDFPLVKAKWWERLSPETRRYFLFVNRRPIWMG